MTKRKKITLHIMLCLAIFCIFVACSQKKSNLENELTEHYLSIIHAFDDIDAQRKSIVETVINRVTSRNDPRELHGFKSGAYRKIAFSALDRAIEQAKDNREKMGIWEIGKSVLRPRERENVLMSGEYFFDGIKTTANGDEPIMGALEFSNVFNSPNNYSVRGHLIIYEEVSDAIRPLNLSRNQNVDSNDIEIHIIAASNVVTEHTINGRIRTELWAGSNMILIDEPDIQTIRGIFNSSAVVVLDATVNLRRRDGWGRATGNVISSDEYSFLIPVSGFELAYQELIKEQRKRDDYSR
jgi:hypothetical protein